MSDIREFIRAASGTGGKATLVIRGGRLVNVVSEEIYQADVAIYGERIIAVGDISHYVGPETKIVDATGKYLAPGMIERRMGKVINVSSQTSDIALVLHGAYAASKNGLNALTKVMTAEWAPFNVQSNAVCPTVILTPMGEKVWGDPARGDPMKARIPLGRFGRPIEVADLVLFLASPASDLITGECIYIDGGYTAM